jgi:hypothetical protein
MDSCIRWATVAYSDSWIQENAFDPRERIISVYKAAFRCFEMELAMITCSWYHTTTTWF